MLNCWYMGRNSPLGEAERIQCVREAIGGVCYKDLSKKYGISGRTIVTWRQKYGHIAELDQGFLPQGHDVRGTSTLYDADGQIRLQWVKTQADAERAQELIDLAIASFKDEVKRQPPVPGPDFCEEDLLSCYVITDYHLGMLAWGEETYGEDWDMDIAERLLIGWFAKAIHAAPPSKVGLFLQLGDFLHYDTLEAITPTSKNILDSDTRLPKIVNAAIAASRSIINMLLEKHELVHIIMAEGNHDLSSSVWLRALFAEKYLDEPRVSVDNTHNPYYAYQWGDVSIYAHHGHKANTKNVTQVMAAMYREMYGQTKFSYCHMGHAHHIDMKENQMMIVEQHPTLAARDAYAARGGYLSKRAASVITYSKKYGEVSRVVIRPEMVFG